MTKIWINLLLILFANLLNASVLKDSIGTKKSQGRIFIIHKVDKGQGLFAISKRYNTTIDAIKKANSNQDLDNLMLGQEILVPHNVLSAKPYEVKKEIPLIKNTSSKPIMHTVASNDNLLSIAIKYNTTMQKIRDYNNLTSDKLTNGQKLIVGYTTNKDKYFKVDSMYSNPELHKINQQLKKEYEDYLNTATNTDNLEEKKVLGTATYIDEEMVKSNRNLALSATIPIGKIVKVTNPTNGKTIYVKIIGKFDPNAEKEKIDIKVTKNIAKSLDSVDKYFKVELRYGN
jgi:LysM repeat protein